MKKINNKFGEGILYDDIDIKGTVFCSCSACMSIYSEFLSWANTFSSRCVKDPDYALNIIVLSCQVTDMAVLNDLRILESYMKSHPGKKYFIGGCLAKRFDIKLPAGVKRLNNVSVDNTQIKEFDLVKYEKPFWVNEFNENDHIENDGHLFRKMYPLRIGVGCKSKCTYCTIRITRGPYKELEFGYQEFRDNEGVVLIADSPTQEQIKEWCEQSMLDDKPISIRNIEPKVVKKAATHLLTLATLGLLPHFHSPIQHTNSKALTQMGRSPQDVEYVRGFSRMLKSIGVFTATNIIVDYIGYKDPVVSNPEIYEEFDYISWNPYWNGVWDREKAEKRFDKYFGHFKK
jgi:tRNA A37 methylthiotransferase MiaB